MRLPLVLIAALVLVMPAAAQGASLELSALNAPAEEQVTAGESIDLGFDVAINVSETTCLSDVELPMNATASVQQGASAEEAPFSFTVPSGDYAIMDPHEDETSVTVTVDTEPGVTEDYTIEVGLQAVFDGVEVEPGECTSDFPSAESDLLSTTLMIEADEEPEVEEEEDVEEDPPEEAPVEEDESPLPLLAAVFAVGLAALLRR